MRAQIKNTFAGIAVAFAVGCLLAVPLCLIPEPLANRTKPSCGPANSATAIYGSP